MSEQARFKVSVDGAGLLLILFVSLKLAGVINWPWLAVLCPLWIGPVFLLSFAILIGVGALVGLGIAVVADKWLN